MATLSSSAASKSGACAHKGVETSTKTKTISDLLGNMDETLLVGKDLVNPKKELLSDGWRGSNRNEYDKGKKMGIEAPVPIFRHRREASETPAP